MVGLFQISGGRQLGIDLVPRRATRSLAVGVTYGREFIYFETKNSFSSARKVTERLVVSAKFCKIQVRLYKMFDSCVRMSLYFSGKWSYSCLFSYTFRLRTSFFNIFFPVFALRAIFPLRRHDGTSAPSDNLSRVLAVALSNRPDSAGGPLQPAFRTLLSPRLYTRAQVHCQENSCPSSTGRKTFNKMEHTFPAGSKFRLGGCQSSTSLRLLTPAGTARKM